MGITPEDRSYSNSKNLFFGVFMRNKTYNKKKMLVVFLSALLMIFFLIARLVYLMIFDAAYYQQKAKTLHEREREIKAARGEIIDRNGKVLATNKAVCTISVIHSQITDPERVIQVLADELGIEKEMIRKRIEKVSSREKIKTNVEKETGDRIRAYELDGVKVDEDFKRYYPYGNLASKVLGFTGGDNQGIIGLEVEYDDILKGKPGKILTTTDARGIELDGIGENREEPQKGYTLRISLDADIQKYVQQAAQKVMEEKQAERVSILLMNPQNGEIYACVNVPEFDLNEPFELNSGMDAEGMSEEKKQDLLNQMWRNPCLNDTYEPGSTFKIITMAAGLAEGVVSLNDSFYCPGYKLVEDRRIHCANRRGHGAQNFVKGAENSCNPVFIEVGLRLGADKYYQYFRQFGLMEKTGIDLPGEAGTIMHQEENMGEVELATVSFGQSFQITPIRLAATVSSLINGGTLITPHFGVAIESSDGETVKALEYSNGRKILDGKISETVRYILEQVVEEGSGRNAAVEGYRIGGKTATSQTLPRSANRYISSFLGFAPANDPKVLALCIIHDPQGIYYGGTIAAPVVRSIFENILPYLGVDKSDEKPYNQT